jgi:hypothetical protein
MLVREETKYGHKYKLDGKPCKGVTTLISGGFPKPQLVNWAARTVSEYVADNFDLIKDVRAQGRQETVDFLKGAHYRDRDRAAARGTEVHAIAEEIIYGRSVTVPEHLRAYVDGYVAFLDTHDTQPIVTERACASREWWYAGTFDAVVTFGAGPLAGQTLLVDWKTSKGVYGETAMQLAAYQNADFYLDDDGTEKPMPEVDGLGVVHITPNGTEIYLVNDPAEAWKAFTHVAWVAKNVENIKKQIAEPVYLGVAQ